MPDIDILLWVIHIYIYYYIGIDILIYLLILFLEGPCLSCPGAPDVSMSWLVPVSVYTPSIV